MKTMTCRQLGGACDVKFRGNSFDEIAQQSKAHGMEMLKKQDQAHMQAMNKMQGVMNNTDEMTRWMESKRNEFNALPDDV